MLFVNISPLGNWLGLKASVIYVGLPPLIVKISPECTDDGEGRATGSFISGHENMLYFSNYS